jgi:hypothetical protein
MDDPTDELYDPDVSLAPTEAQHRGFWPSVKRWLLPALVGLVLALGIIIFVAARRRHQVEGLSVAERVYFDLVNWARRLVGVSPLAHQTPHEYAGSVGWAVPRGRDAIERIAETYVQERFGGKEVAQEEVEAAWSETRPLLWRRWLARVREAGVRAVRRIIPVRPETPPWETKRRASDGD